MSEGIPIWTNDEKHDLDIAKFVIEGDEFVEQIVSRAVNELRRATRGKHLTFASAVTEGSPGSLYAAVEALYLHLSDDYHLLYEFERAFDEVTGEQQIRLPLMTGRANRGTCIDLVILFLSCLANAKLWPVYIHLRGRADHSLGATWLEQPFQYREPFLTLGDLRSCLATGDILVFECTGFVEGYPPRPHKISFAEACEEARRLLEGIEEHNFGFALDVHRAWETGVSQMRFRSTPLVYDLGGGTMDVVAIQLNAEYKGQVDIEKLKDDILAVSLRHAGVLSRNRQTHQNKKEPIEGRVPSSGSLSSLYRNWVRLF